MMRDALRATHRFVVSGYATQTPAGAVTSQRFELATP